jgi:hypothetical protein
VSGHQAQVLFQTTLTMKFTSALGWSLPVFSYMQLCLSAPASISRNTTTTGVTVESRAPSSSKTVIIQMFEWTWDSIAAECTDFIGPAGYGFVQGTSDENLTYNNYFISDMRYPLSAM